MTLDKFDTNPILVNINTLKPYRIYDTITSRGMESTIERERDITNTYPQVIIEKSFPNATLENGQEANTIFFPFSEVGIEIQYLVVGTKITDSFAIIEV